MELNLRSDKSRLYYEAHITLEERALMAPDLFEKLMKICTEVEALPSTFLLAKKDEQQPHAFISMRDESFLRIRDKVYSAVGLLEHDGFHVRRWKIEDTILDSNRGDDLEELLAAVPGS